MKNQTPHSFLRRFHRNKDGATAVEFALILPVFIVMMFGTMEVGNILYAKSTMQHGIETAGRYAMVHVDATTYQIAAEAKSRSKHFTGLTPTFTVTKKTVGDIPFSVISVSGTYTIITPFFTGKTINLSSQLAVPQTRPQGNTGSQSTGGGYTPPVSPPQEPEPTQGQGQSQGNSKGKGKK